MNEDFEYDHNAQELDRQLEEVMDSHKDEKVTETKEAEEEVHVLDRLAEPTSRNIVDAVKAQAKEASLVLREELVRDRLHEYQDRGPLMVDDFLKMAKG